MLLSRVVSYAIKPRIYVILRGGLGNQLHQIAAGVNLAEKNGGKLLIFSHIVDTANNPDRRGFFRKLNLVGLFPGTKINETNNIENFLLRLANLNSFSVVKTLVVSERNFLQVNKYPIILVRGWFQSMEFLPNSMEVSNILPVQKKDLHELTIHIRLTDFLTIDPTPLNSEYYLNALKDQEYLIIPSLIMCFSDDIQAAQELLPTDRTYVFPEINNPLNAYELLTELASSKVLISSKSSLSWWAALCVLSRGGRVVSPFPCPTPSEYWVQLNQSK